ncbi:hypothetical protein [Streptomyces sp. NPDC059874]|uniref:hypothetical protein n=1 Tax=Streptomyces sp. NPDC059874 TaxID=3346983 RepID=UPI0036540621
MRNRFTLAAVLAVAALALTAVPAGAAGNPATGGPAGKSCGEIRLSGSLPAPPAGTAVQQTVTIGPDCTPRFGEVRLVPAASPTEAKAASATVSATAAPALAAGTVHRLKSWNEMFDCCNIRMTGVYSTSEWTTDSGRISTAATTVTQGWNREPWNAGWSLASATKSTDCLTDCGASRTQAHADFTYKGIFDLSGKTYANSHHSYVDLNADGTATCRFDVQLRNSFIGWNWQRGCS